MIQGFKSDNIKKHASNYLGNGGQIGCPTF